LPSSGAGGVLMGSDDRAIKKVDRPTDPSLAVCNLLQGGEEALPDAVVLPAVKPAADRLP